MLQFDAKQRTRHHPPDAWPVYAPPVYPCYYYHPPQNMMMMMVPHAAPARPPPRRRANDDDDTPLAVLQRQMRSPPPPATNRRQHSAPAFHPPPNHIMRPPPRQHTARRPLSPQQHMAMRPSNTAHQRYASPPPQRKASRRTVGGELPQRKNSAASHPPNALRSAHKRWPSNASAPRTLVRSASLPANTPESPPSPSKKDSNLVTKAKRWFSMNRRQR